jgi:prepilin-type processing-associated H-X9-DG protein
MQPKTNQEGENLMSNTDQLSPSALNQFTGSENWYRHGLNRNVLFTDGAKHIADAGGAYWLLDEIALAQRHQKAIAAEEFQAWTLAVDLARHTATLTCEDGNGKAVFTKAIDYTDFPVERVTLWFENSTIYLPSEH